MKKILMLILTLSVILLTSCYNTYTASKTPPPVVNTESDAEILGVQYVRTDGYNDTFIYPRLIKITSVESLEYYNTTFDGIYSFGKREMVYSDTTIGFADAIEKYDSEFFKEYDLYLAVVEEGSGSIRHLVEEVENGYVKITSLIPEVGTDDMAEWHIILEVNKGDVIIGINEKDVPIYTPYEIYSDFLDHIEAIAVKYLKEELGITDAELLRVEKTDFGKISKEGFEDPLGYNPGYPESPVWSYTFQRNDNIIELYLCDSPFVFGYKKIPS